MGEVGLSLMPSRCNLLPKGFVPSEEELSTEAGEGSHGCAVHFRETAGGNPTRPISTHNLKDVMRRTDRASLHMVISM